MVNMSISCEYCEKKFTTRPNLLRHQRTVSSCLRLQKNGKCERFSCSFCKKTYTDKSNLNQHISKCKVKKDSEINGKIKELEKEITKWKSKTKSLKKQLKERDKEVMSLKIKCEASKADGKVEIYDKVCDKVLDKSTITNNTAYIHPKLANLPITNIHPLTEDYVKKQVANGEYTFDHYRRGEDGIVDFINSITMCENDDGIVERNYVSTDTSRDSFHRLVETKEWEKDKGGKFIDVILDTLNDRVDNYHNQLLDERIKYKGSKAPGGYDPDTVYKRNNDMHSGVVETQGKERRSLRKKIKKETSTKVAV
uniref:C2H2-type domain-containing protein n=1 Tax=Marseillevirus LCMAC101 TaxID=2506602 RepID=A0A481YU21_9VIRU|nr:MAG: hypothetical protein LCMAC101_06190 [Marseillevirus LCMAC101]